MVRISDFSYGAVYFSAVVDCTGVLQNAGADCHDAAVMDFYADAGKLSERFCRPAVWQISLDT